MSFKKHIGRIKNTDRRCVVVMTQIPGRDDHALIVDTDALPDRFHDALMQVIESHEGQSVQELHTLLSRRILPDLGIDMLNALHNANALTAQPIPNIIMYPQPHSPCPLSLIVEMQNKQGPVTRDEQTNLENRHLENHKVDATESQHAVANNLLHQARDLESEAAKKREQAYRMVPVLRPAEFLAPVTPVDAQLATSEAVASTATVEEIAGVYEMPAVDLTGLPDDVAVAYQAAIKEAVVSAPLNESVIHVSDEEAAHAVDDSDDALAAFLDRAAYREDRANKIAIEASQPKRPVGRPRKDGLPAGSASE